MARAKPPLPASSCPLMPAPLRGVRPELITTGRAPSASFRPRIGFACAPLLVRHARHNLFWINILRSAVVFTSGRAVCPSMDAESQYMSGVSLGRRRFLKVAAAATAAGVAGIPLFHYRFKTPADALPGPRTRPRLGNWEDLYRQRWTWDKIAKGTHGWANCRSGLRLGSLRQERRRGAGGAERHLQAVRGRGAGFQSPRLPEGGLLHRGDVRPEPHLGTAETGRSARRPASGNRSAGTRRCRKLRRSASAPPLAGEPTRSTRILAPISISDRPRQGASSSSSWRAACLPTTGPRSVT